MESSKFTGKNFVRILMRRKWNLIIPAFIIILGAAAIALVLPPVYRSTATILIEDREVPERFVSGMLPGFTEQRIQSIKHKILSSSRLLEIVNEFNLFKEIKDNVPIDKFVGKMRDSIKINLINTNLIDRRTGRTSEAAIAFTISYEGKEDPVKVQEVTSGLASMFLKENLKIREQQSTETSKFLELELGKLRSDLATLEMKISSFKEIHINELPEFLQANLLRSRSAERDIKMLNDKLQSLKERKSSLQTQLAGIPPNLELQKQEDRLNELRLELVDLKSRFSDEYPDVKKAKAEIAKIEKQFYQYKKSKNSNKLKADNPTYITLASDLSSTNIEIKSVLRQIDKLSEDLYDYRMRLATTPKVEVEYNKFTERRDSIQEKVNDLMKKLMDARVSQGIEREKKGERFTLIEPAKIPINPIKPDRRAIVIIGLLFGLGVGFGFVAIVENNDTSVRDEETLTRETSFPVLASIPIIK